MIALPAALDEWFRASGSRGCAFINGHTEAGGEAAAETATHQRELTARIEAVCRDAACARPDEMVVDLLRVIGRAIVRALMEGADAARAPLARAYARMLAGGSVHTSDS